MRRIVLLLVIDPPRSDVNINIPWAGVQLGIVHVDAPGNVPILTGLHMDCPRVAFVRNAEQRSKPVCASQVECWQVTPAKETQIMRMMGLVILLLP